MASPHLRPIRMARPECGAKESRLDSDQGYHGRHSRRCNALGSIGQKILERALQLALASQRGRKLGVAGNASPIRRDYGIVAGDGKIVVPPRLPEWEPGDRAF